MATKALPALPQSFFARPAELVAPDDCYLWLSCLMSCSDLIWV